MSDSVRIISWQESSEEAAAREIGALAAEGYRVEASGHYPLGSSGTRGRAWVLLVKYEPAVLEVTALETAETTREVVFNVHLPTADEIVAAVIDAFKRGE